MILGVSLFEKVGFLLCDMDLGVILKGAVSNELF